MTVDTLRITRAALSPVDFLATDLVPPTQPPRPVYAGNAPTSIPGLQFWLPPYDYSRFFGDWKKFANPLPLNPFEGMATRSILELSPNAYQVVSGNPSGFSSVQYSQDSEIGPYWQYAAHTSLINGSQLRVRDSTGGSPANFDFVQNTGVFTLSAFINVKAEAGSYMTIFDTNEASEDLPGFRFLRQQDGRLLLVITGGTPETIRFAEPAPGGAMDLETWYQVAAVGRGPGNPVEFYVTPISANRVQQFSSTGTLGGSDGNYGTDVFHGLMIGTASGQFPGLNPFNGGMVNQTIYDRALSPLEIQKLFQYGKALSLANLPWLNTNVAMDVNNDGNVFPVDVLQVVNRLLLSGAGPLPTPTEGNAPPAFVDVSGNGSLEPQDALILINWLLAHPDGGGSVAVPPAAPQTASASTAVAVGALADFTNGLLAEPLNVPAKATFFATAAGSPSVESAAPAPLQAMTIDVSPAWSPTVTYAPSPSSGELPATPSSNSMALSSSADRRVGSLVANSGRPTLVPFRHDDSEWTETGSDADDVLAADRYFSELGIWE